MKENARKLWCRIGVSLYVTPEEMDMIVSGCKEAQEAALVRVFASRRAVLDGDSYLSLIHI